ncbi:hypothetical protein NC652_006174 [Populus alba x Populus x berolinensis]|nr:hypothetical protein NC652_006174 [Populus alba x Populus x berolinensis]
MDNYGFHDGNIYNLLESRCLDVRPDVDRSLQMHSSLIRRLSHERELEVNIWSYTGRKLLHSIDTGHSANIFCSKFVPETSDELVVSGAGDAEVEVGNPNVVWSASDDGTLKQHDFREGASCPPGGSYPMNVAIFCDAFARLYDRRMLPPLTSHRKRMNLPPCANYFFPMHLSEHVTILGSSSLHLTHVRFSPNGDEVLLSYSGEHVYLMNVNYTGGTAVRYTMGDASKLMTLSPTLNGLELQPLSSRVFKCRAPPKTN